MDSTYQRIFELATPYLRKGRPYDYLHTQLLFDLTKKLIARKPDLDERILLPAVILHDIGWGAVSARIRRKYRSRRSRIAHMVAGARLADRILRRINYPSRLRKRISRLVRIHDNPSIGLSLRGTYARLLHEIDYLWRLMKPGFTKDYLERKIPPRQRLYELVERARREKLFRVEPTRRVYRALVRGIKKEVST